MRWGVASILLMAGAFIFFVIWAVGTFLLTTVGDALESTAHPQVVYYITLLRTAFGFIAALFFFSGLILTFLLDATADEQELYWRER